MNISLMNWNIDESMPSMSLTDVFAMPHDETMSFNDFVELLSKKDKESSINYIQVNIINELIIGIY